MADENEGRLTRWSRRKRQAQQTRRGSAAPVAVADTDVAAVPAPGEAGAGAVPAVAGDGAGSAEAVDEEVVRALPDVDSLDKDSDYTPFLNAKVPEKLARAALRKMWSSDPAFNIRDGLDDYDEDFTIFEAMKDVLKDKLSEGEDKAAKADDAEETEETEEAEEAEEDAEDIEDADGDLDETGDSEDGDDALAAAEADSGGGEPGRETAPGETRTRRATDDEEPS